MTRMNVSEIRHSIKILSLHLLFILVGVSLPFISCESLPCNSVKYVYNSKGFNDDVPSSAISGKHLRICEQSLTCCTELMEFKLSNHSRMEFDNLLHGTIGELKKVFDSQTQYFDDFFRELLKVARKDFHVMFLKTYGQLYDKNSYLFSSMFDELEKYYVTGIVDLEEAMEDFFHRLYRKMFPALNAQHQFSEEYLNCVEENMKVMRPFGDVSGKLILDIKRSFTATRTFVQALSVARDVIRNIMEVGLSPECNRSLMKMTYCPHCQGLPDLKPCSPYCLQVLNSCLSNHIEFGAVWNAFIDSLISLVSRLENSFNIETVLEPIDIKISEAIMHFQENSATISKQIFQVCGEPRRGKRDISDQEITLEKLKFTPQLTVRPTTAAGTSIDRLIQNLKKKTKQMKKFWNTLPVKLCNSKKMSDGSWHDNCWDGRGTSSSSTNFSVIPSTQVSTIPHQNSAIINQQTLTLRLITMKLLQAYRGIDVYWEDSSEFGSGSGSGSGYGEDDSMPRGHEDIFFSVPPPSLTPNVPFKNQYPTVHVDPSAGIVLSNSLLLLSLVVFKTILTLNII